MAELVLDPPLALTSRLAAALRRGGARLWIGAALVAILVLVALFAPLIAPHDPVEQDLMSAQLPPAFVQGGEAAYPLGTDSLGRCVLSRLIYSARIAVVVALIANFAAWGDYCATIATATSFSPCSKPAPSGPFSEAAP